MDRIIDIPETCKNPPPPSTTTIPSELVTHLSLLADSSKTNFKSIPLNVTMSIVLFIGRIPTISIRVIFPTQMDCRMPPEFIKAINGLFECGPKVFLLTY